MASHEALTNNGQIGGAVADNVPKDTEQQASSTDQLLQFAQAAPVSIIQIPADVFTSLLQSLNGLQSSIAHLENENRELKHCHKTFQSSISTLNSEVRALHEAQSQAIHNVQKLQLHSGMDFALFPKLPPEIQRMIWGHCANISRVVGIKRVVDSISGDWGLVPTTLRCQLFAVCKEARSEASKIILELEFLLAYCPGNLDFPKIFLNPATDIVWLTGGFQKRGRYDGIQHLALYYIEGNLNQNVATKVVATKVALPYDSWHERVSIDYIHNMRSFQILGTEEVILVVGDNYASKSPDIVFVEPKESPKSTLGSEFLKENGFLNDEITWEEMNETQMKYLTTFQAERVVARHQYFLSTGLRNADDVDYEAVGLYDYSVWTVKSIRYMQATTMTELRKARG
ncbi:hypothetical protein F5882DRAFT_483228 [Hyaloscypha sp. PMI_1271]|nr:hypothetical protein F5882DRAFT_483228 [Hyaloscypha sp. PMI_1271]